MDVPAIVTAILAAIALIAAWLLWRGLRGRVIDDHPICRRCGFDLFGLPDTSGHCPECGSDLSARKATRIGRREVRRRSLAGGVALIVPWTLLVAAIGFVWFNDTDVNRYKPLWWLTRQADATAVGELSRRQLAGELDDKQLATTIDAALAVQADARRPWLSAWGDVIERARIDGKLSDELWQRYAQNAVPLALKARPRVRVGDPVPVEFHFNGVRTATKTRLDAHFRVMRASIEGKRLRGLLPEDSAGGGVMMKLQSRSSGWAVKEKLIADPDMLAPLVGGPRTVQAEVALAIYDRAGAAVYFPPVCSDVIVLTHTITIVPAGESTVELVRGDAALRDRLQLAVQAERASNVVSSSGPLVRIDNEDGPRLRIRALVPPIGLAFQVVLRDAKAREYLLNPITFLPDVAGTWYVQSPVEGFDADVVDVVLRPSAAVAAGTVGLDRIWDEEIVIPDVPVSWDDGATRPTTRPRWMRNRGSRPPPDWFWLRDPRRSASTGP